MSAVGADVTERLAAHLRANNDWMDEEFIATITPRFSRQDQVDRFKALRLRITGELMTHDGVAWTGELVDGDATLRIEQEGRGGSNYYPCDRDVVSAFSAFADELFPKVQWERLDNLVSAVDTWTEMGADRA